MKILSSGTGTQSAGSLIMKIIVPLIITVGLCYVLFTGINFSEMIAIIRRDCDFKWIGFALIVSVFSHIFRAMRWQIQLNDLDCRTPLKILVYSIFGTYAINLVFPRLGELWRTGYISQRQDRPFVTIFGSMVAERLADTATVLLLTLVTFLLAGPALMAFLAKYPEVYQGVARLLTSPWLYVAAVAGIAFVIWFFRRKTGNRYMLKTREALRELWKGFSSIATMPGKGRWLLLTFAIWGCYFSQLYLAFYSFPFTTELLHNDGIIVCLVCFVLSSIAMGIPSNGGIGPWQIAIIFGLSIYMPGFYDAAQAAEFKMNSTAFANLVLGAQTLLLIILGIFTFIAIALDKRKS